MRVAHLAFDLGLRRERGDGVDHHDVDRAGAHQHVGDLERLLAGVGLRDQHVVDVHAELFRVDGVERVLRVDERRGAPLLLRLRDHLQGERGLARGLGSEDLDDAPARQAADPERDVQTERPGRHDVHVAHGLGVAHAHDRALAELLLDLAESRAQRPFLVFVHRDSLCLHVPCDSGLGERSRRPPCPLRRRSGTLRRGLSHRGGEGFTAEATCAAPGTRCRQG